MHVFLKTPIFVCATLCMRIVCTCTFTFKQDDLSLIAVCNKDWRLLGFFCFDHNVRGFFTKYGVNFVKQGIKCSVNCIFLITFVNYKVCNNRGCYFRFIPDMVMEHKFISSQNSA